MKKLVLFTFIFMTIIPVSAYTTEASDFLANLYEQKYSKKPKINVKQEHTEEYQQKIGEILIPAITYGYGDMKVKGERKCRISYICLLDEECKPLWGHIIPR